VRQDALLSARHPPLLLIWLHDVPPATWNTQAGDISSLAMYLLMSGQALLSTHRQDCCRWRCSNARRHATGTAAMYGATTRFAYTKRAANRKCRVVQTWRSGFARRTHQTTQKMAHRNSSTSGTTTLKIWRWMASGTALPFFWKGAVTPEVHQTSEVHIASASLYCNPRVMLHTYQSGDRPRT
jgi:hypothetical protein